MRMVLNHRCRVIIILYLASHCGQSIEGISEGTVSDTHAPRYVMNLDLPPYERWQGIIKNFDAQFIEKNIKQIILNLTRSEFLEDILVKFSAGIDRYVPQPYADEIRGISDVLDIELGYIVLFNFFYEITAYQGGPITCTSIVAIDTNHHIIHGRNMDYDYVGFLKHITMDVEFQRSGKTIYMGTMPAAYIGAATGMKPGVFSFSVNERDTGYWWENVISALEDSKPISLLMRQVLETAQSYDEAIQMVRTSRMIAPNYIIMGGMQPYEGAVIVGDRWNSKIFRMNDTLEHNWFVLQTNYDPWTTPPPDDDRRDVGIKLVNRVGQKNMDLQRLFKVLSTPPVYNPTTYYTSVLSARNASSYRTILRTWHYNDGP